MLEKGPGMEQLIRKAKLHVNVQLGEEDDRTHLIAASNLRLDTAQAMSLWLLFDIEPSLRTPRRQERMYRQAHAWAQAPHTLRSIELPAIGEDLRDAQSRKGEHAAWHLRVEMPGYGYCSYRARPTFADTVVTFVVDEFLRE